MGWQTKEQKPGVCVAGALIFLEGKNLVLDYRME